MKQLLTIALLLVASPAYSETKGFYRLKAILAEGKTIDIAAEMKKAMKNQGGGKYETDFLRMTIELDANRFTIGLEQVMGERGTGTASYCSVNASAGITVTGGKFTIPSIAAAASAGEVKVKSDTTKGKDITKTDTDTKKKNNNCNVSLDAGTYTIKGSGKAIELSYTSEGKPATLQLVADDRDVDLPGKAAAFAAKK